MTLEAFRHLVSSSPGPVVLLEGRRDIPPRDAEAARRLGACLAREFPALRFRSGNAAGSDASFSAGVAEVDSTRLQVVAPYAAHRREVRYDGATYDSPESLSKIQEAAMADTTAAATPRNKALIAKRAGHARLAAKAAYLIRDTMKVVGFSDEFNRPVAALFYIDTAAPEAGGTGHTIRVCRREGVPVAFQDSWSSWFAPAK